MRLFMFAARRAPFTLERARAANFGSLIVGYDKLLSKVQTTLELDDWSSSLSLSACLRIVVMLKVIYQV